MSMRRDLKDYYGGTAAHHPEQEAVVAAAQARLAAGEDTPGDRFVLWANDYEQRQESMEKSPFVRALVVLSENVDRVSQQAKLGVELSGVFNERQAAVHNIQIDMLDAVIHSETSIQSLGRRLSGLRTTLVLIIAAIIYAYADFVMWRGH